MNLQGILHYLQANSAALAAIGLSILGTFSLIAKITPTKADDAIVQKLYDLIHLLGLTKSGK